MAPGLVSTALHTKAGGQNSRYLLWVPAWTPEQVAKLAYRRFKRGWSVTLPGIGNKLAALVMRFVPDFALVPLMGWLFRVRDDQGNVLWPGGALAKPPESRARARVGAAQSRGLGKSPTVKRRVRPRSRP